MDLTRRRLVSAAAATAFSGALAGCTEESSPGGAAESDGATARSSFFVFGDLTTAVVGDVGDAELLVPVGQHGHGWEPGPSVREDIHDADLFVHGMEGFQPWVDGIRTDLEADGSDVTSVDVSAGLDLLEADGTHEHDEGRDDNTETEHGEDTHTDDTEAEPSADTHTDDHDDHTDNHDEDDHGDGMDPHFWMDPLRVGEAVENVREGLADADGDHADAYADNAAALRGRLDELHETLESTVDEASKDVILIAGHDSFQYLGERYDIEVEALTNVSPDDRPTPKDVERAQHVVEEHGLRFVCADPLESQQAAEQLVAETDAEEVLPLTSIPGLTDEWEANGWGYVDVVENVNLPTLERALDA